MEWTLSGMECGSLFLVSKKQKKYSVMLLFAKFTQTYNATFSLQISAKNYAQNSALIIPDKTLQSELPGNLSSKLYLHAVC